MNTLPQSKAERVACDWDEDTSGRLLIEPCKMGRCSEWQVEVASIPTDKAWVFAVCLDWVGFLLNLGEGKLKVKRKVKDLMVKDKQHPKNPDYPVIMSRKNTSANL